MAALQLDDRSRLRLGPAHVATFSTARDRLVAGLGSARDAVIDLTWTDRLDASGVQLLISAKTWMERRGGRLTLVVPDGPAYEALEASGALGLFTVEPAVRARGRAIGKAA